MPQFYAGESKTAKATMSNPKGVALDYAGFLYIGGTQVAETSFRLNAGEEKQISFVATIPSVAGIFPVLLYVYSGGQGIRLYQATEDVEIVTFAFTFSAPQGIMLAPTGIGYGWRLAEISCQLTNPHNVTVTRQIRVLYGGEGAWYGDRIWEYQGSVWKEVTLSPGQSTTLTQPHQFIIPGVDPSRYGTSWNLPAFAIPSSWSFKLVDDLGNESPVITLTRNA